MKFITTMYVTLSESLGIYTADQFYELLSNRHHTQPISRHRAVIIQSRTFFFSAVFTVHTKSLGCTLAALKNEARTEVFSCEQKIFD